MGLDGDAFEPELAAVFETGTISRIISVLLDIRRDPHRASDICNYAGIGRSSFYQHADQLKEYGILEQVDQTGGYRLADTDVAQKLIELEGELEERQQSTVENEV